MNKRSFITTPLRFLLCYAVVRSYIAPKTPFGYLLLCLPAFLIYIVFQYMLFPTLEKYVVKEHFFGLVKELEFRKQFRKEIEEAMEE